MPDANLPPDDAARFNLRYAVRLHAIEDARRRTLDDLLASQHRWEAALAKFRNQRGWQLFLLIRKLTAHAFHEGSAGRRELLRFLFTAPFRGIPVLTKYDLIPPVAAKFLPKPLISPYFTDDPVSRVPPGDGRYDVIILPVFDFNYRFQRPQHLAVQFASHGHRVFWISPNKFLDPGSPHAYEMFPLCANAWEVHLREITPNIYMGELSPAKAAAISAAIVDCLQTNGVSPTSTGQSCVILQFPFWRQIGLSLRARFGSLLAFDCMDEWQTFPNVGEFARAEQSRLLCDADLLVTTAGALDRNFRAQSLHPVLIPNAVDFDLFAGAIPERRLLETPKPIVGYVGALEDWFDFDLFAAVARARPQYSFVLVGGRDGVSESTPFKDIPNISLLGHKPYAEMPAIVAAFDVCIIPFLLNRVTEATDPVKMYEYLTLGKPIVSTPLAEVAKLGRPYAYIGVNAEQFAAQLDLALAEDSVALQTERIGFASGNTWGDRFAAFDAAIRSRLL